MLALAVECVCAAPQQMGSTPVIEDQCEPHIRAPHHPSPSCKSLMPQFELLDVFQARGGVDHVNGRLALWSLMMIRNRARSQARGQTGSSLIIRLTLTTIQLSMDEIIK